MLKSALALAILLSCAAAVLAETASDPPSGSEPPASESGSARLLPNDFKLNLLIRTTLIALNQANDTGNYSVLRDLGAASFREANSTAQLAEIFAQIRKRKLDLSPILFFEPKLVRPPAVQANGHLRLSGFFETQPERVSFDLAFAREANDWRLFGIAVEVAPPPISPPDPAPDQAADEQAGSSQPRAKNPPPKKAMDSSTGSDKKAEGAK
jgi:hypothetical protein